MDAPDIHRGRLVDHIQLVVRDLAASQAFYAAILDVLQVPMGGTGEGTSGPTNCSSRRPTALPPKAC
jgi:hypothetical protein